MCVPHPKRRKYYRKKQKTFPHCVIPTAALAEWRNPPRWRKNHHKVKLATWEDSSTHIRSLGMTCRRVVPFNRTGYSRNVAWRWIIAATLCGSIHPHRLYSGRFRNGTQAVPYGFADTSVFQPSWSKIVRFLTRVDKRHYAPETQNCQLSIVHCQLGNNCQLSTSYEREARL